MKIQNGQKELLLKFKKWFNGSQPHMAEIISDDDIEDFFNNNLALGKPEPLAKNKQNVEDCFRNFIRSKHLSSEWDKWFKEWNDNDAI